MPSEQQLFKQLVSLMGKQIDVGIRSSGKKLQGTVVNAMFDSFLIEANGKNNVIAYNDLSYLQETN